MRIFFAGTLNNNQTNLTLLKKIEEELELKGAEIYPLYLNNQNQKIISSKKIKELSQSDIAVFEANVENIIIGYLIAKALELNKPTIILFPANNSHSLIFFRQIKNDKLIIQPYQNEKNIEKAVTESFQKAQKLRDRRFNFFISPDLLNYLEKESRKLGITKAMLIRQLIIKHQKKSK